MGLRGSTERTQRRILVETTIANERKSVGIAYLLWFFFGPFGGHNYYVGKPMLGAAQLFGYIIGLAMYFTRVPILGVLFLFVLGISLIVDLCFIPRASMPRPKSCASACRTPWCGTADRLAARGSQPRDIR